MDFVAPIGGVLANNTLYMHSSMQFSSLEPDVVCRMVFVKDLEILSGDEVDLDPPHGQTELPTCPVCLERLDMHISGVVTTASAHLWQHQTWLWLEKHCVQTTATAWAYIINSHCLVIHLLTTFILGVWLHQTDP